MHPSAKAIREYLDTKAARRLQQRHKTKFGAPVLLKQVELKQVGISRPGRGSQLCTPGDLLAIVNLAGVRGRKRAENCVDLLLNLELHFPGYMKSLAAQQIESQFIPIRTRKKRRTEGGESASKKGCISELP